MTSFARATRDPAEEQSRRGRWGTTAFIALIAITPAMPHLPVARIPLDYSDLTQVLAAIVGVVAALRTGAWRAIRIRRAPEAFALALIVPFTLIAALHAGSLHSIAAGPVRWLLNAVIVLLAYLMIRTAADGTHMIKALIGVAAFEALFGLVSYAAGFSAHGGLIGMTPNSDPYHTLAFAGRITGTTGMAATFVAGLFALTLPMAAGLAMAARGHRRWIWIAACAVIGGGLALTLSRTPIGLVVLAVAVLLLAVTRPRVWIPVGVVVAAVLLATPLRRRMTNLGNDRLALWDAGLRMFFDHWFFGVGPDRYTKFLPKYSITRFGQATATPHNSLLYVAAESGLLAALALGLAIALSLRFLHTRDPLILGPMLGLAAFVVDGMTTNMYSISSIAVAAGMIAPSLAALTRTGIRAPRHHPPDDALPGHPPAGAAPVAGPPSVPGPAATG